MHSEFYLDSTLPRLEYTLRKAVTKYGTPSSLYVDYTEELTMPKDFHNADQYPTLSEKLRHSSLTNLQS